MISCPNDAPRSLSWRRSRLARMIGCTPELVMIGPLLREPSSSGGTHLAQHRPREPWPRDGAARAAIRRPVARASEKGAGGETGERGKVITRRRVPTVIGFSAHRAHGAAAGSMVVEPFGQVIAVLALAGTVDDAAAHLAALRSAVIRASLGLPMSRGEVEQARALLEAAVECGDPRAVPMAQANLGGLLMSRGELEQAQALLEAAVESGNPQAVPLAQASLGVLLMRQGELEQARALLEAAVESANRQAVPMAQANLGVLLMRQGELEQARALLGRRSSRVTRGRSRWPRPISAGCSRARESWSRRGRCWRRRSSPVTRGRSRSPRQSLAGCSRAGESSSRRGRCWRRPSSPVTRGRSRSPRQSSARC